jgi:hypothetical protein
VWRHFSCLKKAEEMRGGSGREVQKHDKRRKGTEARTSRKDEEEECEEVEGIEEQSVVQEQEHARSMKSRRGRCRKEGKEAERWKRAFFLASQVGSWTLVGAYLLCCCHFRCFCFCFYVTGRGMSSIMAESRRSSHVCGSAMAGGRSIRWGVMDGVV